MMMVTVREALVNRAASRKSMILLNHWKDWKETMRVSMVATEVITLMKRWTAKEVKFIMVDSYLASHFTKTAIGKQRTDACQKGMNILFSWLVDLF